MPKQGEIDYLKNIGEAGRAHARGKPFSDDACGQLLVDIGTIMMCLPRPPAALIDFGCGTGWTSALFARRGFDVVGVDIAPDMIATAEENRRAEGPDNLQYLCSDYESLKMDEQFDCGVFFDCLHHAEDEGAALQSAYRALKPGGILITHEPGEGHAADTYSLAAVQNFDVTEKDMPPRLIRHHALNAGFREFRVLPIPRVVQEIVYDKLPHADPVPRSRLFRLARVAVQLFHKPDRRSALMILRK